ncbi:Secreted protein hcp [Anaerohalosphaera lusitana]|uniref:Secreted protein hcp n=1 Tax=Anaerohalosphaera lusitana TaxID=1936003 RepID=A0A1U9NJY5_9BACT|nr:type VI secretion system tube protein TssD [Anaerohalosphaera lusitana]AQT68219.1 Secreted protein hcp [Anaerohalosphaera lusitana]
MKRTALTLIVALLLCTSTSFAALNAYLRATGETQGNIAGSVTEPGLEGSIAVIGSIHEVVSPRDAASGLPTGKRQHKPFKITKTVDKASPLLANSLTSGEHFTQFELQYWQPAPDGTQILAYTIRLHNAQVCGIKQQISDTFTEQVSLTYDSIEWIWEPEAIAAQDDWDYQSSDIRLTDLSGDGIVDIIDLAILASDWLERTEPAQ